MTNNGGSAFPAVLGPPKEFSCGMSLRDWFAGQALVGIAEPMMQAGFKQKIQVERQAENMAAAAYLIADAMIAARKAGA